MTAIERIEALTRHLNVNVKVLSELCGYERPQAFYDILKGKTRNISSAMSEKISAAFPEIDKVWLLTGAGTMLRSSAQQATEPRADDTDSTDSQSQVPLLHLAAIAGPLSCFYQGGEDMRNCPKITSPVPNSDLALPITGDSMEPMFEHGSILFIKRINEEAFIPWGNPMVIDTENGIFVKTIFPDEENPTYVWAKSVNPKYPPMHVPKSSIYGMYRVVANVKPTAIM